MSSTFDLMVKVYTLKTCSSCRKATDWLRERGVDFEEIAIRETPPSIDELQIMLSHQSGDLRKLFNTAGGDYRELQLKDKLPGMSESSALELLSGRGNLVKRPFLLGRGPWLVGFKIADWEDAFSALGF